MSHGTKKQRIWDLPTRTFHWGLVVNFFIAFWTREDDHLALFHIASGYTILGLLLFRILWGFVGTYYARFRDFVKGPKAILTYLKSLFGTKPDSHLGHNPAGGVSVLALIFLGLLTSLSGWLEYEDFELPYLEEVHEWAGETMLVLVLIHIAAVFLSAVLHRENLILAMLTGYKKTKKKVHAVPCHPNWAFGIGLGMVTIWLWVFRLKWFSVLH